MKPILVVDDEVIMRESLRDWLSSDGYQVEIAEDGEEALKAVAEQEFSIAILDMALPRMNGIEVFREAKAKNPKLKGIIITAYPSVRTAVEAMKEGVVDYLSKPFPLNKLEAVIRNALGPVQVEVKPKDEVAPAEVEPPLVEEAPLEERGRVEEAVDLATGQVCLPPCQIACPIGEDIQRTNAMISLLPLDEEQAYDQIIKIGDEIHQQNPLFTVCSFICGLCERECNYKDHTGAVRRMMLKRFITHHYIPYLDNKLPLPYPTKEKVAVIGGGPGGLMCAYRLVQKGYRVTIMERDSHLGGALRYIPQYRLPTRVIDSTLNNLVRLGHIEVRFGVEMGEDRNSLEKLYREGFRAVFIATGTLDPRPLMMARETLAGADLDGVISGLYLLHDINRGKTPPRFYRQLLWHKKVIVIGGGNVAFDVARTVRRLGGDVTMVCLENADQTSRDKLPAEAEEVEGALQEGILINYSRGVEEIIGEDGRFKAIKCPRCTSVFDSKGFNPKFDHDDVIYLEGDVLMVTIGQGVERAFFRREELLDQKGRLDVDPNTLMSYRKEGVFIGGDARRVGFAAEAMRDGVVAAESIDSYLRGEEMKAGPAGYQKAAFPELSHYKPQPEVTWLPVKDRLNFEPFEKRFTLEEAVAEAKRCLCCGPCQSCKGCVMMGLQPRIAEIALNEDLCSGCGVCVAVCPYDALRLINRYGGPVANVDEVKCKRCGLCASSCPSGAINIKDDLAVDIASAYQMLEERGEL